MYSMRFDVYPMRREGRLIPRHAMWAGRVRGDLFVIEVRDTELNRSVRVATIVANDPHRELLPPLLDATLVAVKPDWWTMTGWERSPQATHAHTRAYMQSWILIPSDIADTEGRAKR
jgi:hypothetical protein